MVTVGPAAFRRRRPSDDADRARRGPARPWRSIARRTAADFNGIGAGQRRRQGDRDDVVSFLPDGIVAQPSMREGGVYFPPRNDGTIFIPTTPRVLPRRVRFDAGENFDLRHLRGAVAYLPVTNPPMVPENSPSC